MGKLLQKLAFLNIFSTTRSASTDGSRNRSFFLKKRICPFDTTGYDTNVTRSINTGYKLASPIFLIILVCIICACV